MASNDREVLVWVDLEDHDLAGVARRLGEIGDEISGLEAAQKQTAAQARASIKALANERVELEEAARMGRRQVKVMAGDFPDYGAGVMVTRRLDTREEVSRRPLTVPEQNMDLFEKPGPEDHIHVFSARGLCLCGYRLEVDPAEEIAAARRGLEGGAELPDSPAPGPQEAEPGAIPKPRGSRRKKPADDGAEPKFAAAARRRRGSAAKAPEATA